MKAALPHSRLGLQIACALLFVLSLHQAAVRFFLAEAEQALKQKQNVEAYAQTQKVFALFPASSEALFVRAQAAWQLSKEQSDPKFLEQAVSCFREFVRNNPRSSKGWLYLGLSLYDSGQTGELKAILRKAHLLEPGNASIANQAGIYLLKLTDLSATDKEEGLSLIEKSLRLHYYNQYSENLKPDLDFLWQRFHDFSILKRVVPKDVFSYHQFGQFLEERRLWKFRAEIQSDVTMLTDQAFEEQCRMAEKFLSQKSLRQAYDQFVIATWMKNDSSRAKAGVLASAAQLPATWKDDLKQVLEEEEESLQNVMPYLQTRVRESNELYLQGLWAYRLGNYPSAVSFFEKSSPSNRLRRYLLHAYFETGKKEKAAQLADSILAEPDPDLRELRLIAANDYESHEAALEKESSLLHNKISPLWWGKDRAQPVLRAGQNSSITVQLKPGKVRFCLHLLNAYADSGSYVRIRLWDGDYGHIVDEFYLDSTEPKIHSFETATTGGKRLLQVELVKSANAEGKSPLLKLGDLEMEFA